MKKISKKRGTKSMRSRILSSRKGCPFCKENKEIDYKDIDLLSHFLTDRGKIISRRSSGVCNKHQRKLSLNIKRARYLSLLPYIKT